MTYRNTVRSAVRRLLALLAAILLALFHPSGYAQLTSDISPAQSMPNDFQNQPPLAEVHMFVGETRVLPQRNAGRLAVGDGKIVSAAVLDDREILLIANGPGDTTVQVWTKDGRNYRLKVIVRQNDMARVSRDLQAFLDGIPNVTTRTIGDNIVIEGANISDSDRDKIEELARRFPQVIDFTSRVGFDRMFVFDVKFVEISRSGLKDLGLDWTTQGKPVMGLSIVGDIYHKNQAGEPITATLDAGSEVEIAAKRLTPFSGRFSVVASLFGRLNLLAQKGDAVVLAQPRLAARNRGAANFLAGGEIPIATASATGTPNIEFKEYGVKLDILEPVADDSGTIRAQIRTEVSSLDRSVEVLGVPGLLTRRTETEFNLQEGETLVLSGIISRDQAKDMTAIPVVGDVPVLGSLFKSKRFQNRESELVVFVTPWIVRPGETNAFDHHATELDQRAQLEFAPPAPDLSPEAKVRTVLDALNF